MLARADTKVRGRFCVNRFGPSHRREQTASAVPKNFVRQLEKTFSTVSANTGRPHNDANDSKGTTLCPVQVKNKHRF